VLLNFSYLTCGFRRAENFWPYESSILLQPNGIILTLWVSICSFYFLFIFLFFFFVSQRIIEFRVSIALPFCSAGMSREFRSPPSPSRVVTVVALLIIKELRHGLRILKSLAEFFKFVVCNHRVSLLHPQPSLFLCSLSSYYLFGVLYLGKVLFLGVLPRCFFCQNAVFLLFKT